MFDTISKETIELFDLKGNISYEKAFVWGLFFAEGTSGNWGVLEKAKSSWIIYNLDKDLLTRAKSMIEKVEDMTFIISGLYKNQGSGIYHLKPNNNKEGSIVSLSKNIDHYFMTNVDIKEFQLKFFNLIFIQDNLF